MTRDHPWSDGYVAAVAWHATFNYRFSWNRLRDVDAKETVKYHIVGSAEANPAEFKLSNESPVGRAILGHKKGETVEVLTPRGSKIKFKIMEISAA